jgi:GNAT superfamily N-acetyltransferase
MSQIDIRQVTADDHAAWLPLWQAYLRFYNTELPEAVTQSTWQRMLDPSEPTHAALAWADDKAVGMENSCYLQDLLVTPETRGTGVGRQLIEFVYTTAKADGCCKVHWLTHETNATAIQLYERIAERPGFIQFRKAL